MQGSSRHAETVSIEALALALNSAKGSWMELGDQLFAVTEVIDSNASLRRALTDPSAEGAAKAALAKGLFAKKISDTALQVVETVVSQRWANERDLSDTMEQLAVRSILAEADKNKRLDSLESDLFRFERIVAGDEALREAFSGRNADAAGKSALVAKLLKKKVGPETEVLASRAATHPRGRRFDATLARYLELAASRGDQLTAIVTVAEPITSKQVDALSKSLAKQYGKAVVVQVVIDPAVIGGVRVDIADDVIDGTLAHRLDTARRHISGN